MNLYFLLNHKTCIAIKLPKNNLRLNNVDVMFGQHATVDVYDYDVVHTSIASIW